MVNNDSLPVPSEAELAGRLRVQIKTLRGERGMSQRQLAARLGISKSMVTRYEAGLHLAPAVILVRMARVFSVSVDRLLGHELEDSTLTHCLREIGDMDPESRVLVTQVFVAMLGAYRILLNRSRDAAAVRS